MATRVQLAALLLLALFAVSAVAEGASRSSLYVGGPGSGKSFKAAKIGLLNQYAKAKGVTYKVTSEKLDDTSYSVTYEFPSATILADFQTWQYKQPLYAQALDKFSKKQKGTNGRRLAL